MRSPFVPAMPRYSVNSLSVRKGGALFTAVRAVGLGWERFYVHLREHGKFEVGDVKVVDLRHGRLQVKSRQRWVDVSAVDVELSPAQQRYLTKLVFDCDELLWRLGFCILQVDVQKDGPRSGSFDVKGYFRKGCGPAGISVMEFKMAFGKDGYGEKLEEHKINAAKAFEQQLRRGKVLASQLLMVAHVSGTTRPSTLGLSMCMFTEAGGWSELKVPQATGPLLTVDNV